MKNILLVLLISGALSAEGNRRIVTVGAIASELVCALGSCGEIVGTDVTSVYPPELAHKPKVGYITRLSSEGLLALKPTHVVVVEGAGPAPVLSQLKASGVSVLTIPVGLGLADAEQRLELVGEFTGRRKTASKLKQNLRRDLKKLQAEAVGNKPVQVLFIYARGAQTLLAMGSNTTAHELIELAGARNAFVAEGAKPINAEAVAVAAPDVVVIPEGSLAGLGGKAGLKKIPGLAQTPAGKNNRVVTLDDSLLAGLGPRSASAARTLRRKIHEAMQNGK
jgi:iron complex transport system substrate-binding protein